MTLVESAKKPEVLANAFLIGGGVIMAVSPSIAMKWWVFALFLIGHIGYIWHGMKIGDRPLYILNIAMVCLDVYAIYVRV